MTKKPSAKNREWEKDRRDRLNAAMDKLGLLLPHCSPSTPPSKIEIVQRAIHIVEELQRQVRDLLAGSNASILKSQLELEDSIRALLLRNESLHTLLKKAKITAPPFLPPKAVESARLPLQTAAETAGRTEEVSAAPPVTSSENYGNDINVMSVGRPPKHSQRIGAGVITIDGTTSATTSREQKSITTSTQTTAIPPARLIRLPMLQSGGVGPLVLVRHQLPSGKSVHRLIRHKTGTVEMTTNDKVAIPALKRRPVRPKIRHKRNRKKLVKVAVGKLDKSSLDGVKTVPAKKKALKRPADSDSQIAPSSCKRTKTIVASESSPSEVVAQKPADPVVPTPQPPSNKPNHSLASTASHTDPHLDHFDPSYPASAALARPVDLSQDILDGLNVPQHESNPESLSPTAAFLLSFPVVSTRPDDPVVITNNAGNDCQQQQQHNILENITTLLTTKDYDRFVEDVAKTEQNLSCGGVDLKSSDPKPLPDTQPNACNNNAEYNTKPESCLKPKRLDNHQTFTSQMQNFAMEPPRFSAPDTAFTFSLTSTCSTMTSTASATRQLGFYDTLSNIGSGSRHVPAVTVTTVAVTYTPNLYSNALSLASSSSNLAHKAIESNYSMETPFTFSLSSTTTTSQAQLYVTSTHSKDAVKTESIVSAPITRPALSIQQPSNNCHLTDSSHHPFVGPTVTYNPFAFDNVPGCLPVTPAASATQFTFSLTSSTQTPSKTTATTKQSQHHYAVDPAVSMNANNSYSMMPYNFYTDSNTLAADKPVTRSAAQLPFSVCSAVTPKPALIAQPMTQSTSTTTTMSKTTTNDSNSRPNCSTVATISITHHTAAKPHVNWMTSSSTSAGISSSHNSASVHASAAVAAVDFNPTIPPSHEYTPAYYPTPKPADLLAYVPTLVAPPLPDDTFVWSPNKLLDASAASSTLPTLHGDLALNNFGGQMPAGTERTHLSAIASTKRSGTTTTAATEKNSFSVSHLVEQRKPSSNNATGPPNKQHPAKSNKDVLGQQPPTSNVYQHSNRQYSSSVLPSSVSTSASSKPVNISSGGHSNAYSTEALLSTSTNHHHHHQQQHYRNKNMLASSSSANKPSDTMTNYSHIKQADCSNPIGGSSSLSAATASAASDIYLPSVGDSTYNYYPNSYLANQGGSGSYLQHHQHQHSESDYLGATTSEPPQKNGSLSGYVNHQHHQQHATAPAIPHAYPFNNTATATVKHSTASVTTSSSTHHHHHSHHRNHQHYSNNYKCVGDIASGATTSSRRSHQPQANQHSSHHPNEATPIQHQHQGTAVNNYNFQSQMLPAIVPVALPPASLSSSSMPTASTAYDLHYRSDDTSRPVTSTNNYSGNYQQHGSAAFMQHHQHRPAAAVAAAAGATVQQPSFAWTPHQHVHGTAASSAVHSGVGQHYGSGGHGNGGAHHNSSGLVSNFNLSTICPEINSEKGNNW